MNRVIQSSLLVVLTLLLFASCSVINEILFDDPVSIDLSKTPTASASTSRREAKEINKERQKLIQQGKCPDCSGIGKTADGKYNCATCNGTGKYSPQ